MNKKGFTLIELIVTISLLAMISLISFVSINKAIQKSKDNECENIKGSIKSAALIYFSNHRYDSNAGTVTGNKLLEEHLISEAKNPYNKQENINLNGISVDKNGTVTGMPENCEKYKN